MLAVLCCILASAPHSTQYYKIHVEFVKVLANQHNPFRNLPKVDIMQPSAILDIMLRYVYLAGPVGTRANSWNCKIEA